MKKFALALSLFAALGATATAQAANEVKALEVVSTYQSYYIGANQTHFEATVANLGYTKVVNVHARLSNGTWTDIPLTYNRPADTGREVWSTDLTDNGSVSRFGSSIVFALSYTVNGQTYWDNNSGANYTVANNSGVTLYGTNIYNRYYNTTFSGNTYGGTVSVRNIAPTKQVNVVYTTDGWKTSKTVAASYNSAYWTQGYINITNPSPSGFEEWTFPFDVTGATTVQYVLSYTVNGQTYWDNNFGNNYTITRQ